MAATLSEIIDAIGDLLTDDQKGQLVTSLLDDRVDKVRPGDLITAGLFNQMLGDIADLAVRVSALEGSGGEPQVPVITGIEPNPATVGQDMTIFGENLTARFLTAIEVGDVRISTGLLKVGSSPTKLVFTTPGVTGAVPQGIPVLVRVANDAGAAQSACVVRSGIAANLAATFAPVLVKVDPAGQLQKKTDYTFDFDIDVESSHPETFKVTPILDVTPATGWTIAVDGADTFSVNVTSGVPVKRSIKVKLHTGDNLGSGNFTLHFAATTFAGFERSSVAYPVAVGAATDTTDGPIKFQAPSVSGDQTIKTFANGTVFLTKAGATAGQTVRLSVPLTIEPTQDAATYDVSFAVVPGQNAVAWNAALKSLTQIPVSPAGGTLVPIRIDLIPAVTAPDSKLVISVNGQGALPDATLELGLRIVDAIP